MEDTVIERPRYLQRLKTFQDKDLIKVVTGVRRCGKSTLLDLMKEDLLSQDVPSDRILSFKMESMEYDGLDDYRELYRIVMDCARGLTHPYLFFDELQDVPGWERAINSLRVDLDCDIYITGSNAHLLSSELSTLISGRYIEVEMRPLVFEEYLRFRGFTRIAASPSLAQTSDGSIAALADLFADYRRFGGFPFLSLSEPDLETHRAYMRTLYETVIVRDILERARRRGDRELQNRALLERICAFLADNVGNPNSVNSIAKAIKAEGLYAVNDTVDAYVAALTRAYLFYHVQRFDIKVKDLLKTNGKHYVVDTGIRSYLDGYRDANLGHVLENIVFHQLSYQGYGVNVGKLRSGEVDFVAQRGAERVYIQVTENMLDDDTMRRELAPLRAIPDAYPKMVVVGSGEYPADIDGIRIVRIEDYLLSD